MIAANNVTLRVGKKALFEDVNIKFTEGNCYGMIGSILISVLIPRRDISISAGIDQRNIILFVPYF